jgi:hypothetical protein
MHTEYTVCQNVCRRVKYSEIALRLEAMESTLHVFFLKSVIAEVIDILN